jgi:hypothetical protein
MADVQNESPLMVKKKLDPEMQQFQTDLLQSIRDMKTGRAGRVHLVETLNEPESAIQQVWTAEAKDRLAAFDDGEIHAAPIAELLIKMRAV